MMCSGTVPDANSSNQKSLIDDSMENQIIIAKMHLCKIDS